MANACTLIHITPELPPTVGGIADYTAILSRRLVEASEGTVEPVLVRAGWKQEAPPEGSFPHVDLGGRCSASALAEAVARLVSEADGRTAVLLEYSGYGYARRGAPLWLARGLRWLKSERPRLPLVTMYHELYATSRRPWTSTFWLAPLQRGVAAWIARLSDGLMTNREASAEKLRTWTGDAASVRVSPTFSNVGEPEALLPYEERAPYAVVFGGAGRKAAMYAQEGAALGRALQKMGVERVVDLGTRVPEGAADRLPLPVEMKGVQPEEAISAYLQKASVGVVRYPLHCLTKSGIWAAYAAHGLPTVFVAERQQTETFVEGRHFMLLEALAREVPGTGTRAAMSRAVKQWYDEQGHSRRAARELAGLLQSSTASSVPKYN